LSAGPFLTALGGASFAGELKTEKTKAPKGIKTIAARSTERLLKTAVKGQQLMMETSKPADRRTLQG
jgi:hypothetical protein